MTFKTIQDFIEAYALEHKYELARREIELRTGMVKDQLVLTASSFPDAAGKVTTKHRSFTLPELNVDPRIRDPEVGLRGVLEAAIGELIAELAGGHRAESSEGKSHAEGPAKAKGR